jgi:hypothetical protein
MIPDKCRFRFCERCITRKSGALSSPLLGLLGLSKLGEEPFARRLSEEPFRAENSRVGGSRASIP